MFRTCVRLVMRDSHVGEAAEIGPAAVIVKILKQHGTMNKLDMWEKAEEAGVKSKRQMKMTLRWLKEKNHINIVCNKKEEDEFDARPLPPPPMGKKKRRKTPPPDDKEFLYKLAPRYFPKES